MRYDDDGLRKLNSKDVIMLNKAHSFSMYKVVVTKKKFRLKNVFEFNSHLIKIILPKRFYIFFSYTSSEAA